MGVKKQTVEKWNLEVIDYELNDAGEVQLLFCKLCREIYGDVGGLPCSGQQRRAGLNLKGTVAAQVDKWVTGTTVIKKCNAIDHITKSKTHRDASLRKQADLADTGVKIPQVNGGSQSTIPEALKKITASQKAQLTRKFQLAHFVAVNNKPFKDYENFAKFEKEFHCVDLGSAYLSDRSCREMVSVLATCIRTEEITRPLNDGRRNYFSVFYDGSSSAKTMDEKELYVIKTCSDGIPVFQVMSLEEPEDTDARGLKKALDASFAKQGFAFDRGIKQIGNGSDGAAVNNALFELEKTEVGSHLIKGWCANHKGELGISDSFKHVDLNSQCQEDLSSVYYFFKKANLRWRLIKRQGIFMEKKLLKYKRPTGTRWVSHQVDASDNYLRNLAIFIGFCNHQIKSPHNKTMKDSVPKLTGFLKNAMKLERCIFLAARKDVLAYLSPFAQCLEKQTLLMPEAVTSMKAAISTLEVILALMKEKGAATLYMESYFPTLAKLVWPYLDVSDADQYMGRQTRSTSSDTSIELSADQNMSFHGYSMSTSLDKALSVVITNLQSVTENLVKNLTARFSDFLCNPLYIAVSTVLDTKAYQFKSTDEVMSAVQVVANHFSKQLEGNGCDVTRLRPEMEVVHVHVRTFLKSSSPCKAWPQLFRSSVDLGIKNILHVVEIGIVVPISSAEVERMFSHFVKIIGKERQSLSNKAIDDLLVIRSHGIPADRDELYKNAVTQFLTQYPDGEVRKRTRRPAGYQYKHIDRKRKRNPCTANPLKKRNCLFIPEADRIENGQTDDISDASDSDSDFVVEDIDLADISSSDMSDSSDSDTD